VLQQRQRGLCDKPGAEQVGVQNRPRRGEIDAFDFSTGGVEFLFSDVEN